MLILTTKVKTEMIDTNNFQSNSLVWVLSSKFPSKQTGSNAFTKAFLWPLEDRSGSKKMLGILRWGLSTRRKIYPRSIHQYCQILYFFRQTSRNRSIKLIFGILATIFDHFFSFLNQGSAKGGTARPANLKPDRAIGLIKSSPSPAR